MSLTAKEMAELAKQIVSVNRGERGNEYVFSYGLLKDFINQLCKEQREICQKQIPLSNIKWIGCAYDDVLNAPQPEVL